MAIDLKRATLEELQAEFVRLGNAYSAINAERLVILKEITDRKDRAAARVRLRSLDDHEKDALREELKR